LNEFLLGVKGPKNEAINIKKKVELFLKSNLHLILLENKNNLINIHSDNLFIFNVNISSKPINTLLFLNKRSNLIQQQKKNIKLRKLKIKNSEINIENKGLTIKDNKNNILLKSELIKINNETKNVNKILLNKEKEKKFLIVLNADLIKIKNILINTGLLNKKAKPVALRKLLNLDSFYIISVYNNIAKLILNSFLCCDNLNKIKKIIDYHIR
jgi:hypothetical protein